MKKFSIAISSLTCICLLVAIISLSSYNKNHLSADLRRTLIEAAYPTNSLAQVETYLHEARTQIHTRKDDEVYTKFHDAFVLAEGLRDNPADDPQLRKNEIESKRLYDEVRSDLGLTVFKTSWFPLFDN